MQLKVMAMKYSKNSLNEVIFHIKFSPLSGLYSNQKEAILEFQKEVEDEFPKLDFEKRRKLKYNADNTGKFDDDINNEAYLTWILTSGNKQIKINEKELRLIHDGEIYDDFDGFMEDVTLVLKGLRKYDPKNVECIGLRYINQFEIKKEDSIDEYFNSDLHLRKDEFSKEEFVESLTKTDLIIGNYDFTLKYGRFNPDYPNRTSKKDVVLDYDCIYNYPEKFECIAIHLQEMHEIIHNRFESDIKDELRKEMGQEYEQEEN